MYFLPKGLEEEVFALHRESAVGMENQECSNEEQRPNQVRSASPCVPLPGRSKRTKRKMHIPKRRASPALRIGSTGLQTANRFTGLDPVVSKTTSTHIPTPLHVHTTPPRPKVASKPLQIDKTAIESGPWWSIAEPLVVFLTSICIVISNIITEIHTGALDSIQQYPSTAFHLVLVCTARSILGYLNTNSWDVLVTLTIYVYLSYFLCIKGYSFVVSTSRTLLPIVFIVKFPHLLPEIHHLAASTFLLFYAALQSLQWSTAHRLEFIIALLIATSFSIVCKESLASLYGTALLLLNTLPPHKYPQ